MYTLSTDIDFVEKTRKRKEVKKIKIKT